MSKSSGFCVKCKAKREMKDVKEVTSHGHHMLKGRCSKCNTKMNRFVKK